MKPDGPKLAELAEDPDCIIHFHCENCHRHVPKSAEALVQQYGGMKRVWAFARTLRCKECSHLGFSLRIGFRRGTANVPHNVF